MSAEIEAAEEKILQPDKAFWTEALSQKIASPERHDDLDISGMIKTGELSLPEEPTWSPPPVPRNLKVEVPLLPLDDRSDEFIGQTRVLAAEDLCKAKELICSSDSPSRDLSPGQDMQLITFCKERALTVMRTAEQERLEPIDATARVRVPVVDFALPSREWEDKNWTSRQMYEWLQKTMHASWQLPKWPQDKLAEQRMVWVPLAHMAEKKLVAEQIRVSSRSLAAFLGPPKGGKLITSADCVDKRPGLAVLRAEFYDDDEEIPERVRSPETTTPAQPSASAMTLQPSYSQELASLVQSRKRRLADTTSFPANGRAADEGGPTDIMNGLHPEYTELPQLADGFVQMSTPKKPKLTHSSYFGPPPPSSPMSLHPSPEVHRFIPAMPPPPVPIPAMAPTVCPPERPPRVIISTTISPAIVSHLTELLPGIQLISRNYGRHSPPGWVPGLRCSSFNGDEPDIIPSPATGILITTLVRLRQKPLPVPNGSNRIHPQPSFRNVVCNVAGRHERLFVLVSEGNKHSETMSPLSPSDAKALAEFQGFTDALSSASESPIQVQMLYVGGGHETLAKWVASLICKHALSGRIEPEQDLVLPMETLWELWLRRAGMNVFAAQVALWVLKPPEGAKAMGEGQPMYGLPRFVVMSREERARMFQGIFEGRGLLDRVSDAIDEPWEQPQLEADVYSQDVGVQTDLEYM